MLTYTYPHVNIDVLDNSKGSQSTAQSSALHIPFFFTYAEKGPVGIPVECDMASGSQTFGSLTFDQTKSYWTHQSLFATTAMGYQKVYLIRVADPTATAASMVLLCTVTPTQITQYQVDVLGNRTLDSSGNPIPKTDANGTIITQPGYTLGYSVRSLNVGETFDSVEITITGTTQNPTSKTYPILGVVATSVGSAVNRQGFSFYASPAVSQTSESNVLSALYRFAPITLAADASGVTSSVIDVFTSNYNDVSLKSSAVDPTTGQDLSLNGILSNNYTQTDGTQLLDYQIHVYSSNVSTIGADILAASPELSEYMTDPFQVNILSALDANGNPYQHAQVTTASANVVSPQVVLYNQGGTDGPMNTAAFESLVVAFVQGTNTVEFQDNLRYPFSHFYDSGFALTSKYALMNMFDLRDDVKIDFSTQDMSLAINTQAQDQSSGAAILARVRTYPESTLYGTPTTRAEIHQQCGQLSVVNPYIPWVPTTLDRLIKRCSYYSGDHVTGSPKGRPNSEVTIFRKLSWSASTPTQKELNWETALNTISYADRSTLFRADIRSVYPDATSLLSDGVFSDFIVFVKHIAREKWTIYTGREDPITSLFSLIANDIDTELNYVFGSAITCKTTVYQTDADKQAGYSCTINISMQGTMPNRIWNVLVPVSRAAVTSSSSS